MPIRRVVFVCSAHGEPMAQVVREECARRDIELLLVTDSKYLKQSYSEEGLSIECLPIEGTSDGEEQARSSYECEGRYYYSPNRILSIRANSLFLKAEEVLKNFKADLVLQRPGGEILRRAFYRAARKNGIACRTFGEDVFSAGGLVYSGEFKKPIRAKKSVALEALVEGVERVVSNEKMIATYDSPVSMKKNRVEKICAVLFLRDFYLAWTYFVSIIEQKLISRARAVFASIFIYKKLKGSERYYFFPLNVEAESELHVRNPLTADQYLLCKLVLGFLPKSHTLIVKEHPGNHKSLSFFKMARLKIAGAVFVKSTLSGRSLVRGADGVIVNSSTVGLEAIAMGKPLLWLGVWPFSQFIRRANSNVTARAHEFFEDPEKAIVDQQSFVASLRPYVWEGSFYKSEASFRNILGNLLDSGDSSENDDVVAPVIFS